MFCSGFFAQAGAVGGFYVVFVVYFFDYLFSYLFVDVVEVCACWCLFFADCAGSFVLGAHFAVFLSYALD